MKHILTVLTALLLVPLAALRDADASTNEAVTTKLWSKERAWEWYRKQPWLVGFNFVPSTAVNDVEMWQAETFDPVTIDRELGWAHDLGFNTARVFTQYIVWKQDPEGFKKRFDKFLELADKHGISVMPTLFDDCSFGTPRQFDPFLGKQREPIPGSHNPSWVPSPGRKLANDPAERSMLKKYVQDMLTTYGKDKRVIVWDLFNEPMNVVKVGNPALLEEIFTWGRAVNPDQPLTIGQWDGNAGVNKVAFLRSDVISFHAYIGYAGMQKKIEELKKHGRPLFCTEWMGRANGSKWNTDLPLFKQQGVTSYCWGLVNGRTQTHFAWSSKPGDPEPKIWFHDLLLKDGTPYDPAETEAIRKTTADKTIHWDAVEPGQSTYRGWPSLALTNDLIEVQVVPDIGGRVIQFKLGNHEFLWVNDALAGKTSTATGLAPDGGWLNYGGDKLWPAPQGWDNDQQWPGPPDAVLDGQPYRAEVIEGGAAVRLTSRDDPRSGIRFSRTIRPVPDRSGVRFEATMTNVDTKPRRWGIWAHTQLNAAKRDGLSFNPLLRAFCPLNRRSKFPRGYGVIFGEENNPSFRADRERGLVCVDYRYLVGKIGVDSPGGWVATVDGASGAVFVQRFVFEPGKEYPDGASVEFWHNGAGKIHAYNKDIVLPANPAENPYVFESEVLSPFARLAPGESYTWRYEWFAANIGGDWPVLDCTALGITCKPLVVKDGKVTGHFGVFCRGTADVMVDGKKITSVPVSPSEPFVVNLDVPATAKTVSIFITDSNGKRLGELK